MAVTITGSSNSSGVTSVYTVPEPPLDLPKAIANATAALAMLDSRLQAVEVAVRTGDLEERLAKLETMLRERGFAAYL